MNFAMATLALKEMGNFLWEGWEKSLPSWLFAKLRQPTGHTLKEFSLFLQTYLSWVLLENAKKNLVLHFGGERHASFLQTPVVKWHNFPCSHYTKNLYSSGSPSPSRSSVASRSGSGSRSPSPAGPARSRSGSPKSGSGSPGSKHSGSHGSKHSGSPRSRSGSAHSGSSRSG